MRHLNHKALKEIICICSTSLVVHLVMPACEQVVLFLMPGQKGASCIDAGGRRVLGVCRALGLPTPLGVACSPSSSSLQDRAAAKKAASAALALEVRQLGGESI